jgi:hypothetical protein
MAVALEQRDGVEVRVETGRGVIVELGGEGQRNRHVKIRATHADLKELVTGWLDTNDAEALGFVLDAHRDRTEVEYRVEVKRKGNAPAAKPIAELGNREKVRELVSVRPVTAPPEGAPEERPATPAQETPPPAPAEERSTDTGAVSSGPQNGTEAAALDNGSAPRRPKVAEGKPWEEHNTDGSPNVGSWAVQAGTGMAELAVDLLTKEGGPAPTLGKVQGLSRALLALADEVQAGARNDGHADRCDNSHARARGCVRTALRYWPVPFGATDEERDEWRAAVVAYATGLLRVAVVIALDPPEVNR